MNDKSEKIDKLLQPWAMKPHEVEVLEKLSNNFDTFPAETSVKMENFTNWVRHRDLARFLYRAEIYRSIVNVPGVIFEAGVFYGASLSTWIHLGEIYEPVNYGRRVFGFDTFEGFPDITDKDSPASPKHPELYQTGTYDASKQFSKIEEALELVDQTRKISQIPRLRLVKGDVCKTIPRVLEEDKSILISLLYLDVDLYEPTRLAIEACLPRMPKGAVICIDEMCYEDWPGETEAVLNELDIKNYTFERSPIAPNIGVIRI
jgi:hypothetical protein